VRDAGITGAGIGQRHHRAGMQKAVAGKVPGFDRKLGTQHALPHLQNLDAQQPRQAAFTQLVEKH
jgi:hypothetical protein